jgi:quercetin dioxygenase-like cupin family protein
MYLNADFSRRAAVHGLAIDWIDSPMPGVSRKMLDRVGGEVARATSIVRYAAGSHFSRHTHGGGEEFLVLDGVFQDENGDYPTGSYVRNPPQSSHAPGSEAGCIILVKLWQFAPSDSVHVHLSLARIPPVPDPARSHVLIQALHRNEYESVRIETWAADQEIVVDAAGGLEVFVLDGDFEESGERFRTWSWLRLPPEQALRARTGAAGARMWVKQGHLTRCAADMPAEPGMRAE